MPTKKTIVVFEHDTGYGDSLLQHINSAIRGKDMHAIKVLPDDLQKENVRLRSTLQNFRICDNCGNAYGSCVCGMRGTFRN